MNFLADFRSSATSQSRYFLPLEIGAKSVMPKNEELVQQRYAPPQVIACRDQAALYRPEISIN